MAKCEKASVKTLNFFNFLLMIRTLRKTRIIKNNQRRFYNFLAGMRHSKPRNLDPNPDDLVAGLKLFENYQCGSLILAEWFRTHLYKLR
jgi:hypothetical protein